MAKSPVKREPPVFGADAQDAFLTLVGEGWPPSRAAKQIRVKLSTIESRKSRDKAFAEAYRLSRLAGSEIVLEEMHRRGVEGFMEPVYYQGNVVGHIRKYSDRALSDLARGLRPDMFDPRVQVEVTAVHIDAAQLVEMRALGRDETAHGMLEKLADAFVRVHQGPTHQIPAAVEVEDE
jgi:hypothetical protein